MLTPEQLLDVVATAIKDRKPDSIGPWSIVISEGKIACKSRAELKSIRYPDHASIDAICVLFKKIDDNDVRLGLTAGQWEQLARRIAIAQKNGLLQ